MNKLLGGFSVVFFALVWSSWADLRMPSLFSDGMVLQQGMKTPIWGRAVPHAEVEVRLGENSVLATADEHGRWRVLLPEHKASFTPHRLEIVSGEQSLVIQDVLFGEVWLCSGQSNMAWPVMRSNDSDLEALTARFPHIRYIKVPQRGTQELQDDFEGQWVAVSPGVVSGISAVAYFFGRWIYEAVDVPVGLIHNAWGGSSAEAWIRRDVLEADGRFEDYLAEWRGIEATYDYAEEVAIWEIKHAAWKVEDEAQSLAGLPRTDEPKRPGNRLENQHRPGNLYAGVLSPVVGYGIRGVIWYQGESNAGRAYMYRHLFPLLISHWRAVWGQGDFPFYWVQLTSFRDRKDVAVDEESTWPIVREGQAAALSLPNTGQAVIYDLGEGRDIHPRDKQNVARRLARLALADVYGKNVVAHSPSFARMERHEKGFLLQFDHVGDGLYAFDVKEPRGFAIAGDDRVWVHAQATMEGKDTVYVWSDEVPEPVAVRYAWADHPDANVQSREGLPLAPFRTDDWPVVTQPAVLFGALSQRALPGSPIAFPGRR